MFNAVSLQGTKIVRVSEFTSQFLKDLPVTVASRRANFLFQEIAQVEGHAVIVEQRIIYVEQKYGLVHDYLEARTSTSIPISLVVTHSGGSSRRMFALLETPEMIFASNSFECTIEAVSANSIPNKQPF